jgi:transposase
MNRDEWHSARLRFLQARAAGQPWRDALVTAGLPIGRSTAYALQHRVRLRGEEGLVDHRHGHPTKFREDVRTWLEATCRAHPEYPSGRIQQELASQFDLSVSTSQINRVRASLGVRYQRQPPKPKKSR